MPSKQELIFLQGQSLERKVRLTQTRIIEWYERFNGQVYVSFSGGKDSTVLLDLARRVYPDIEAVFINTGLEYPEIVDFVKTFDNVTVLRPKMQFNEVINIYGYPIISKEVSECVSQARKGLSSGNKYYSYRLDKLRGLALQKDGSESIYNQKKWEFLLDAPFNISNRCCDIMKKNPAHNFSKISGKNPITGQMADESRLRAQQWIKNGCNGFDMKKPISNPMSFWSEQDVLHYLQRTGIPYCSVYGDIVPKDEFIGQTAMDGVNIDLMTTGCQRTGCMFCMFGVHLEKEPNRFQKMKITHPKLYDYCIREENGLGIGKVLDYIGVKY